MVIRELTTDATLELLKRCHLGRLACAKSNQPYICPITFAYHANHLYCTSTIGKKIKWMRDNPLVAVLVDEIDTAQKWQSVVISGRYEELTDTPDMRDMRHLAWSLLQQINKRWWEPAYVKTMVGGVERPAAPLYFRICIDHMTGHRATLE